MKRILSVLGAVVVIGLTAGLTFAAESMRIEVPFAFYVEDQNFPAGLYQFDLGHRSHTTTTFVNIWTPKGKNSRVVMTTARKARNATSCRLVFSRYGKKLFLSTITVSGYKATLDAPDLEHQATIQVQQDRSGIGVTQR